MSFIPFLWNFKIGHKWRSHSRSWAPRFHERWRLAEKELHFFSFFLVGVGKHFFPFSEAALHFFQFRMATPMVAGGLEATGPPGQTLGPTTEPGLTWAHHWADLTTRSREVCSLQVVPGKWTWWTMVLLSFHHVNKARPRRRWSYIQSGFPADDDSRSNGIRAIVRPTKP